MDPVARRAALTLRQADAWSAAPPGPVYVAGSTGSQPATAALMRVVANLPQGCVVLPGLDQDLPRRSLGRGRPQPSAMGAQNVASRCRGRARSG